MLLKEINKSILIWGIAAQEALSKIKRENNLIIVPENRPYLLGLKHNIPVLKKENIDFVYCTDNMLGFLFYKDKIKKTILFFKEQNDKGIVGICGSNYAVMLSKLHNIPVEVIPQGKLNMSIYDKDAGSIDGKSIISKEDEKFVVEAEDEFVEWGIIRGVDCNKSC